MHYLRRTLLLLSFLLPYLSHAQSDRVRCATDVVMQRFYENHPEHLHEVTNGPTRIYRPRISSRSNPIITIPVHVIITHPPGQAIGQGANLSLPRILSQINVMNDDFRRFNADAGNTPSVFDAVDAQIQFCLASVDPQGNPTDGITRFPTNLNLINNEVAIKTATGWDNQRYMNVWVGSLGNLLGYAYLPSPAGIPSANVDGIVVATGAFGGPGFATDAPYDEGRTATHEIGHYLGLRHVWGPGNGSCGGDDGFVDTPNQSGPNFGCPVHPSPSCGNGGDMFMNYMDYVNDDCMNAFSADQVAYMRLILETSRATLASSAATACNLQGAPLTAFIANQTDVSCAGDADGTIDVDVLGGTPDYTFVLNGVTQSDGLFTNLPAGNYTVTVFDEQGAFIDISTTINAPNLLVPFVDVQQDVSCEGAADGIITLGASGGTPGSGNTYTYSLNNGPPNTTGVFTDLEPGTYLAQVVDENGCTGQLEIVMSTSNPIEVTLLDLQAVSCAGNDDGSVSISASGGTPAYQYSLNGEDFFGSGTFENLASGDYTVIVLDANECVGFIDVQIEESNPLNLLIESQEPALCFGDSSGQVSLSIVGGTAPFSYAIDNETPQTSPVFSELPAADYTFTVIDANACITSIEATVESQDSIGLMLEMVQDVSCFGDTSGSFTALAFGGAPNYLYQLDTFELDTINTFSNLAAGTYMLAVEDSLGCSANFEIELATNDSLALAIDSIAGLSCFEGTDGYLEWSGAGGLGDYSLSINNDTTVVDTILNGLSAGIYTLSMSDSLGCTVYDTVAIAMPFPINITDLETTPISCAEAIDGQVVAAAQGGTGTLTYTLGDETNTTGLFEQLSAGSYTLTVEDQNGCSTLQDVAVAAPTALTAEMDMATNVSCAGANDGAITVLAQGGTGALSFSLNGTSNTTGSFTELAGGDYTILVSDENDCQTEVLVTIEEPIALSTDSEILTAIDCAGELGAIQFEATGGTAPYSFALNGSTNSTGLFDGVQGGTYTATITDDNGCTLTSTATLNSPTPITIEVIAQTNPLCAGEANGTLQLTANGGTGTLTYTLGETTNTSGTFNNLNPGEYTIVVADQNGCTSTVDVTLDALQPITVEMGMAANVSCAGASDGAITILAQGGTGALSFTLNGTSNTTGSFTELAGGDYTILVSDENTCQTEVLVTIEEPTALSTNSEILTAINCAGELGTIQFEATGGTAPYSFELNGSTNSNGLFDDLTSGAYTATITDDNGCTLTSTATLNNPTPINAEVVAQTNPLCAGEANGTIQLAANGGTGTLTYTLGETTNTSGTFDNLDPGEYTIVVADQNGCTSAVEVTLDALQPIVAEMGMATNVSCAGASDGAITILAQGGTGALSFTLNGTSNTTGNFTELAGGDYTILVSDENTCQTEVLVTIEEPTALSTNSEILTAINCAGELGTIQFEATGGTAPYSFALNGNTNSSGLFDDLPGGAYTATITDDNGCTMSATATLNNPTPLSVEVLAQTNPLCAGEANGTLQLTANGGTGTLTYTLGEVSNTSGTFDNLSPGEYTIAVADENGCTSALTITIDAPTVLTAEMGMATNVSCAGANDGAITVLAQGGTGALSFTLNGISNTTGSFTELAGGDYTILVSDENACQTEVLVTIEEPTALNTNSTILTSIDCAGELGDIQFEATGGTAPYSFELNGSTNNTGLFGNLQGGTYTAIITDDNGCTIATTATLEQPAPITLEIVTQSDPLCAGEPTGSVQLSANGGVGTLTYTLGSITNDSGSFTDLVAGTYEVVVQDENACTSSQIVEIVPTTPLEIMVQANNAVACQGESSGSIQVEAVGGTGTVTYTLDEVSNTTGFFEGLSANTYEVQAVDENNCLIILPIIIEEPEVLQASVEQIRSISCNGALDGFASITITGGTAPYMLGMNTMTQSDYQFDNLPAGNYVVEVLDANACSTTLEFIIPDVDPVVLEVEVISDVPCAGGFSGIVQLDASGGNGSFEYILDGLVNSTGRFEDIAAGTYAVEVVDENGCSAASSVEIVEPTPLELDITIFNEISCFGATDGSIQLEVTGGVGPYLYFVSDIESADGLFNNLGAGTYMATVFDANQCPINVPFTVEQPAPLVVEMVNIIQEDDGTGIGAFELDVVGGTPPYQFALPGGVFSTDNSFSGLPAGEYTIRIRDANDCLLEQLVMVPLINSVAEPIGSISRLIAWPNPFSESVTLEIDLAARSDLSIQVYNVQGQHLGDSRHQLLAGKHQLRLEELRLLPKGTYFLRVQAADATAYLSIIKQ